MPAQPPRTLIPEVLERHLEELAFLWMQRHDAVCSPDYNKSDVKELEERIRAHRQGAVVCGEAGLPLLEERLVGDRWDVFAAAHAVLQLRNQAAADRLMEAFSAAEGETLDGLREALCRGPLDLVLKKLEEAYRDGPAAVAAAAAEVLAVFGRMVGRPGRLDEFFKHEDPSVRCAAWKLVALIEPAGP